MAEDLDRLSRLEAALEQAQFLNEAAQRRHSDTLERHETLITLLSQIQAVQQRQLAQLTALQASHQERMDRLEGLIQALKDLWDRGNGH